MEEAFLKDVEQGEQAAEQESDFDWAKALGVDGDDNVQETEERGFEAEGGQEASDEESSGQEQGESAEEASEVKRLLSDEFEELSRRDREVRQKERQLKEASRASEELQALQELAKSNPIEAARKLGLDPIHLMQGALGAEEDTKEPDPIGEVQSLRQEIEQLRQQQEQERYQAAVSSEYNRIRSTVGALQEKTPLVAALAEDEGEGDAIITEIFNAAKIRYQETGELANYEELVQNAEEVLTERYSRQLKRLSKIEKLKALLADSPEEERPAKELTKAGKTLGNSMTAESTAKEARKMTREEREREVIQLLKQKGWTAGDDDEEVVSVSF